MVNLFGQSFRENDHRSTQPYRSKYFKLEENFNKREEVWQKSQLDNHKLSAKAISYNDLKDHSKKIDHLIKIRDEKAYPANEKYPPISGPAFFKNCESVRLKQNYEMFLKRQEKASRLLNRIDMSQKKKMDDKSNEYFSTQPKTPNEKKRNELNRVNDKIEKNKLIVNTFQHEGYEQAKLHQDSSILGKFVFGLNGIEEQENSKGEISTQTVDKPKLEPKPRDTIFSEIIMNVGYFFIGH